MSEQDPYRIYIAHNFDDHSDYHKVIEYIESRPNFFYTNCAKPDQPPEPNTKESRQEAFRKQIKQAEIVLFPIQIYGSDSQWFDFQLVVAEAFDVPILGIQPFGETASIPPVVTAAAAEIVNWDSRAITDKIRQLGRGEDLNEWEVVEFTPE